MNVNINFNDVVSMAQKILSGDVDFDTYHFAFSQWWDVETEEFYEEFLVLLDCWCSEGVVTLSDEELDELDDIAMAAIEAATHILYNVDISEVVDENQSIALLERVLE